MPEECIRMLEGKVQKEEAAKKQVQLLGEKMDQAKARFRRAVEAGEEVMQALHKAQENFEQAQQEVMQARTDLDGKAYAGSPRSQRCQFHKST